jgi:hypothetical protein
MENKLKTGINFETLINSMRNVSDDQQAFSIGLQCIEAYELAIKTVDALNDALEGIQIRRDEDTKRYINRIKDLECRLSDYEEQPVYTKERARHLAKEQVNRFIDNGQHFDYSDNGAAIDVNEKLLPPDGGSPECNSFRYVDTVDPKPGDHIIYSEGPGAYTCGVVARVKGDFVVLRNSGVHVPFSRIQPITHHVNDDGRMVPIGHMVEKQD